MALRPESDDDSESNRSSSATSLYSEMEGLEELKCLKFVFRPITYIKSLKTIFTSVVHSGPKHNI